jgi:type IV secretory pathway component VirB8
MFKISDIFSFLKSSANKLENGQLQTGESLQQNQVSDKPLNALKATQNWYEERSDKIIVQRNLLMILLIILTSFMVIATLVIAFVVNSKQFYPFVIQLDDNTGRAAIVSPASSTLLAADDSLTRYFIKKYLVARETYNPVDFTTIARTTVRLFSTSSVYYNYLGFIKNKDNEEIKTKWFTRDTWSGRYLNYNSHHSTSQKNSVIIGLTDRALTLTSPEFRPQTLRKVKKILTENNFPTKLINRIIKQRTFKFYNKNLVRKATEANNSSKKYIAMPYTHELSEKIKYIFKKHDIVVCHKTQNMLSSLFIPLKSKVVKKKEIKCNLFYTLP